MDVTLKVLAGAKVGAKVAIRKSEFVIGRSDKCHLCVGTTSISRRHCAIMRAGNRVTIKDLGSRNGTIVNGKRIEGEVELKAGDEVGIGPLLFQVRISTGLSNEKKPKVKSVAEAVDRTASKSDVLGDDDISSWLLGPSDDVTAMNETQTIQMDETNALDTISRAKEQAGEDSSAGETSAEGSSVLADESDESTADESGSDVAADSKSKEKVPGKLPFRPEKTQTKDSREAAEAALRNWSRRR